MTSANSRILRHSGFTLIELMIVIAILAVLAKVAAPSFSSMIASQRVKSAASDLLSDMQFARSQALARGRSITVAALNSSWNNGWTIADGTTILKTQTLASGTISITKVSGTDDQIVHLANGRSSGNFQLNFTSSLLTSDDQKRCLKSSSAAGTQLTRGIC